MKTKTFFKQMLVFVLITLMVPLADTELKAQHAQPVSQPSKRINNNGLVDTSRVAKSRFSPIIINAPHNTYGYDIYDHNHKLIHQPCIPGLPGNDGFKTKADALKVAQLVCKKLEKGEMPPTVSIKEMKELKVIQ